MTGLWVDRNMLYMCYLQYEKTTYRTISTVLHIKHLLAAFCPTESVESSMRLSFSLQLAAFDQTYS